MKLRMSSVVEKPADLEQKMSVEHPAYEIVEKDFIEEYGAAATLYRHKKSGAELLSVSTDDDNKVFGITFRTPRKLSTFKTFCISNIISGPTNFNLQKDIFQFDCLLHIKN